MIGFLVKRLVPPPALILIVLGSLARGDGDAGFTPLFNGQDLSGWSVACRPQDRGRDFWTVADGAIVCDSIGRPRHDYVWLVSDGEFSDFTLTLKFQAFRGSPGNSGLQFRSRFDTNAPGGGYLDGPQVDIHPPPDMNWRTGLIYDETRGAQRWIEPSLPNAAMDAKFKPSEYTFVYADEGDGWNDLTLICKGLRVKTIVNGHVRADFDGAGVLDDEHHKQRNVGRSGRLALQLHANDELRIRFKDIQIQVDPAENRPSP